MDYNKQIENENGLVFEIGSLYDYLQKIEDTRKAKGKRYKLIDLLVVMMLAKLSGEDKPSGIAEWIAHRKEILEAYHLTKAGKAASHMTYRRIMQQIISAEEFERIVQAYHKQRLKTENEIIVSVDGKTVRGTISYGSNRGTHLLAVYVPKQRWIERRTRS